MTLPKAQLGSNQEVTRYPLSRLTGYGIPPLLFSLLPDYFLKKVQVDAQTGCWNWTGWIARNKYYPEHAYGMQKYFGEDGYRHTTSAHRFAYVCIFGQIPAELDVDHRCNNKLCVNPAHLEAVTHQENCRRRHEATHCKRGHLLTPENWYVAPTDGKRRCKACYAVRSSEFRQRRSL